MKRLFLGLFAASLLFILPGCWPSPGIQHMDYVTAIGLDYQDNEFVAYIQVLSFSNVAKSEQPQIGKSYPNWVGKGKGKTVTDAVSILYQTSQLRVFWGHVRSIVLSEAFLKQPHALRDAYDAINRYHEIRYNVFLYATNQPMTHLLVQKSILNLSPLDSILDSPQATYQQISKVLPKYSYKINADMNEPMRTTLIPSLVTTDKTWMEDGKKKSLFYVDGAYALFENQYKGYFTAENLDGMRWLQKQAKRIPLDLPNASEPKVIVMISDPRHKITPVLEQDKARFDIHIRAKGYVQEMMADIPIKELENMAEEEIKKQISATYATGLARKADLYNFASLLYRKHSKEWKNKQMSVERLLQEDSIKEIKVKVRIVNTGKYKGRTLPNENE